MSSRQGWLSFHESSDGPCATAHLRGALRGNHVAALVAIACIVAQCYAPIAFAQIPAVLNVPTLGYVFDDQVGSIRPVVGILGNARIEAPLALSLIVKTALILPDQQHAIVISATEDALVTDLETLTSTVIGGLPSGVTAIRISTNGNRAALYYASTRRVLLVDGLPKKPAVHATIDVSLTHDRLSGFAISDDGNIVLLSFSTAEEDFLYSWTPASTLRLVTRASHITDIKFVGNRIVFSDSGTNQAFLIQDVGEHTVPVVIADESDGIIEPVAIAVSNTDQILVANAGSRSIVVFDSEGRIQHRIECSCALTELTPLRGSAFHLTHRLDQPLIVLDASSLPGRTLFIPALQPQPREEAAQ